MCVDADIGGSGIARGGGKRRIRQEENNQKDGEE